MRFLLHEYTLLREKPPGKLEVYSLPRRRWMPFLPDWPEFTKTLSPAEAQQHLEFEGLSPTDAAAAIKG